MVYNRNQVVGANESPWYQRYIPQQAPLDTTTMFVIGGSVALVATVLIVKQVKSKKKRKRR
jgi:hypothetical protein